MLEAHVWNEWLDLGHEAMDHEHHYQVGLLSALAEALERGRPLMARRLWGHLAHQTAVHFGSEEMALAARPGEASDQARHVAEHARLLDRIGELKDALDEGAAEVALSVALDLRAALAAHILDCDSRLVAAAGHPGRS